MSRLLAIVAACAVWGCANHAPLPPAAPPFRFANDTFAFSNETVWEYNIDDATLERLVRDVLVRDARATRPSGEPVVIPGYADLRQLSAAHRALFERALGGALLSHLQRGNWRMIFPFPAAEQRHEADQLAAALRRGETPILHVVRFPALTLNHMILLFDVTETPEDIRFDAYDPNDASAPIVVRWDRGGRTFVFPRTPYFGGGPVKAYGIYDGLLL